MNKNKQGKNETGSKMPLTKQATATKRAMPDRDKVILSMAQQVAARLTELRFPVS